MVLNWQRFLVGSKPTWWLDQNYLKKGVSTPRPRSLHRIERVAKKPNLLSKYMDLHRQAELSRFCVLLWPCFFSSFLPIRLPPLLTFSWSISSGPILPLCRQQLSRVQAATKRQTLVGCIQFRRQGGTAWLAELIFLSNDRSVGKE